MYLMYQADDYIRTFIILTLVQWNSSYEDIRPNQRHMFEFN